MTEIRIVQESPTAPGEVVGDLGRARQDREAVQSGRQQRRQVLLDGDVALELQVVRAIGDAVGALPEHRFEAIAANTRANRQGRSMFGPIDGMHLVSPIFRHRIPRTRRQYGRRGGSAQPTSKGLPSRRWC